MATASKQVSGMTVKRDGNKFICEWKIPSAGYGDGQQFKATTVSATDIGKTTTKKTVTIDLSQRYPAGSKLTTFWFSVRGNSNPKSDNKGWSEWKKKEITIHPPKNPVITKEKDSSYGCKFSWKVDSADKESLYPFKRVEIQTKLVENCKWAPEQDDWTDATEYTSSNAEDYKTITESSGVVASGSHTRLFRVRAQGCGGDSDWVYSSHVYGASNKADQTEGKVSDTSGGYDIVVNWDTTYDPSTPIDESVVEWVITTPNSDMSCPSGLTWNTGTTLKDTEGKESTHITVDARIGADQCLYTRVNTVHDGRTTYGNAQLQKVGSLSLPTGLSVENVSQEAQTAKITATNASSVSGSVLAVIFRKNGSDMIVGLITGSPNYLTVKCPAWESGDSISFGVQAVLPKSTSSSTSDGVTIYTIDPYMTSSILWQSGSVATAPSSLSLSIDGDDVRAKWTNTWEDANLIELSWSDNPHAWESTDDPDTFIIDNPYATSWRIANLATGKTWYVKVRSVYDTGDGKVYSPYSAMAEINLASAPNAVAATTSKGIIAPGEGFTISWDYESTDGTAQSEGRIFEYANNTYTLIAKTSTQEYADLSGWDTAGTRWLCVETISESGQSSGKSTPISITVAEPPSCSMINSLEEIEIEDDDESIRTVTALTALPLTATVLGADTGGTTSLTITRAEDYQIDRPDDSTGEGFEGETIFDTSQTGDGQITVNLEDLLGALDDGAKYILTAMVTDNIGQTAAQAVEFEVHWTHQAAIPSGNVLISSEDLTAHLMPIAPTGAANTDTCDIYRLSADKPELIFKSAAFGQRYVDPYPAIGDLGGYRFVCMTANGDYITEDNMLAMYDAEDDHLYANYSIIDFAGEQVTLAYDLDFSSDWDKGFVEKETLSGAIRGYWRKGVKRKGDVSAVVIPASDTDTIRKMRALCEHTGPCHVRTPEGSSFPADVQASESWDSRSAGKIATYKLKITRIKPEDLDGVTLNEWREQ